MDLKQGFSDSYVRPRGCLLEMTKLKKRDRTGLTINRWQYIIIVLIQQTQKQKDDKYDWKDDYLSDILMDDNIQKKIW